MFSIIYPCYVTCHAQWAWVTYVLTWASQNMDEEMSKLVAVKIIQTYTHEEAVWKSILVSLDNSSTLLFILDNSALKIANCCWLVLLSVFPAFVHEKISVDKKWSSSVAGRVLTLFIRHTVTLQFVEKSVQIGSHLLICVCIFFASL